MNTATRTVPRESGVLVAIVLAPAMFCVAVALVLGAVVF